MMLYGDRAEETTGAQKLEQLTGFMAEARMGSLPIERHAALVDALIVAGELMQGIADQEFERSQEDDDTVLQQLLTKLLLYLGRLVARSWSGTAIPASAIESEDLQALRKARIPERLVCKTPEGYAYYALYPELYLETARSLSIGAPALVLGLRSIGTSLAAIVAAGLQSECSVHTIRPLGDVFDRRVALSLRLQERLRDTGSVAGIVADEGPGLSGSSFAAAADCLENLGIPSSEIMFLPSHTAGPGPKGSSKHRRRWRSTPSATASFNTVFVTTHRREQGISAWAEDLIGPIVAPLRDISAGRWRDSASCAPVLPRFERRKYLAETAMGTFLLKFNGLGIYGRAKAARARTIGSGGFTPAIIGFRHGILVQTWRADSRPCQSSNFDRDRLIETLARYIAFRTEKLRAGGGDGATIADLVLMVRTNTAEALDDRAARRISREAEIAAKGVARAWPIHVDGRMHAWEWLLSAGGDFIKTDAIDHASQHDLIGCQDPAWDIIGARIELDLDAREFEALVRRFSALTNGPPDPDLLRFYAIAYPAFQLGLWSSDTTGPEEESRRRAEHSGWYKKALLELAA